MFQDQRNCFLVEHGWLPHSEFLELVASMDVMLQVSFSETFNIVSADAVVQKVPIVVSEEIFWASSFAVADFNSSEDICEKINQVMDWKGIISPLNLHGLRKYNKKSRDVLLQLFDQLSNSSFNQSM